MSTWMTCVYWQSSFCVVETALLNKLNCFIFFAKSLVVLKIITIFATDLRTKPFRAAADGRNTGRRTMKAIKLFEDVLASWRNNDVADIELAEKYSEVFRAYNDSVKGGNDILTFRDISYLNFETSMNNIHESLLELGIKKIAIAERSTALMSYLWSLTNKGWQIKGMALANTPHVHLGNPKQEPAIILTYKG